MNLSRREFVSGLSAFAGLAASGYENLQPQGGRTYSVSVLGDLHYDTAPDTVYHAKFVERFKGSQQHASRFKEFSRNAAMWAGTSRKILAASGKCATGDTALVLQVGDLIQGDCNDGAVHRRMLDDAAALMKSTFPATLPFVTVCGNHDVRSSSKDSKRSVVSAYAAFSRDFHRKELGARTCGTIDSSTFAFRQGPDLYLVIDFNLAEKQAVLLERILDENKDARYTFVVTHGGVFPLDAWARQWVYRGGSQDDKKASSAESGAEAQQRELCRTFAKRNVIVLCGHTHQLELKDAEFPEGRITEMTTNTVPLVADGHELPAVPKVVREGAANYGSGEKAKSDPTLSALLKEQRLTMRRYYVAKAAGHAKLRVSDKGVWFDYYGHDALKPTKTFTLR